MDALDDIKARLAAATPGPWDRFDAQIRHTQIDGWVDPAGRAAAQAQTENDIQFVMNAPVDVARLVAAVENVEALAAAWDARGKHLMNYSEECPESVRRELYEQGEEIADNARKIRAELAKALRSAA